MKKIILSCMLLSSFCFAEKIPTLSENKFYCKIGIIEGCHNLGYRYQEGEGVRQDYRIAAQFYEKACDNEYYVSCNNLGLLYFHGYGVTKDCREAMRLWEKACNGRNGLGCLNLGRLYEFDNDCVERNDEFLAMEYYGLGCDFGEQASCDRYKKLKLN